jgi:hypothetical protein
VRRCSGQHWLSVGGKNLLTTVDFSFLHWRRMDPRSATIAFALVLGACAGSQPASNLRPDNIPPGHGAVIGRVTVFKGDSEVTRECYVAFTDEKKETKASLKLDKSGWIFAPMTAGATYLSFVTCAVWNGLTYGTRQLQFDAMGQGAITYFGHVRFDLANNDWAITAGIAAGAVVRELASVPVTSVTGALASTAVTAAADVIQFSSADGENNVTVKNESEIAIREYVKRYGQTPKVFSSLAGSGR